MSRRFAVGLYLPGRGDDVTGSAAPPPRERRGAQLPPCADGFTGSARTV
jgi:hypothetical protein